MIEVTVAAPIAIYCYTLTAADALAYERLPRELPGLQKFALFVWLGLGGAALGLLPETITGSLYGVQFWLLGAVLIGVQYLIFRLVRGALRWLRARRRYPQPVEIGLEQWADRLILTQAGRTRTISFQAIGMLLPTPNALFAAVGKDLLIVPRRAFAGENDIMALADAIDAHARETIDRRQVSA